MPGNIYNEELMPTGKHGTLKSPLTYYPPNMYCRWLIIAPEGKFVELTFKRIQIGERRCSGYRCYVTVCPEGEYVQVWSGNRTTKYCGTLTENTENIKYRENTEHHFHIPKPIRSSGQNMTVIFMSDSDDFPKYTGFEATFKFVDDNSK